MERIRSASGVQVSWERRGDGPPLVLVHGSFSDHRTNWQEVAPLLADRFALYAVARRGRGETDATRGHGIADEARDVVAVLETIPGPAFLLGHSYGAQTALAAAALTPDRVRKLVLYEPPWPSLVGGDVIHRLEALGQRREWDALVATFMRDVLQVPPADVAAIRASPDWTVWTADAPASLADLRALVTYAFEPARARALAMPVLLLVGTESPRALYATDALAAAFPDARVRALEGQGHEGMTTAPRQFADVVAEFLLGTGGQPG